VGHVDHVDHLILSAGLMAGGRGGHAIVDNVDQLKNNGPHCPHNFGFTRRRARKSSAIVDKVDNVDHAY
jgi:hypothetical protein